MRRSPDLTPTGEREVVVIGNHDVGLIHAGHILNREEREGEGPLGRFHPRQRLAIGILNIHQVDMADAAHIAIGVDGREVTRNTPPSPLEGSERLRRLGLVLVVADGRAAAQCHPAALAAAGLHLAADLPLPLPGCWLALALFVSVVATLSRIWRDSEMVVWQTAGLPQWRFLRPLLRMAWPVVALVAALGGVLVMRFGTLRILFLGAVLTAIATWPTKRDTYKALDQLSDTQLADIGLPPEVAAYEAERPIWDAPSHWLRK